MFRGDNGVQIDSTWDTDPIQVPMTEGTFPGLLEGLDGMKVGGRRAIIIPPDKGFGPEGSPTDRPARRHRRRHGRRPARRLLT